MGGHKMILEKYRKFLTSMSPASVLSSGLTQNYMTDMWNKKMNRVGGNGFDRKDAPPTDSSIWSWNYFGYRFCFLGAGIVVYFTLLLLVEKVRTTPKIFTAISECFSRKAADEDEEFEIDPDVQAENARLLAPPDGEECQDIVQFKNLRKRYGPRTVVRDITFGVGDGEIFGFLGVNGAGKTTSMKMMTGDVYPT
eukprot:759560_1